MISSKWFIRIERTVFGIFVLSLLAGLFVPIYTDEVGWRLQERAAIDGGVDRMLNDLCGPNTIITPPLFMMPFRYLTSWINAALADPMYVRIIGVLCAVSWAMLLWHLIARIAENQLQRSILRTMAFAFLGTGWLPWLMVMSRPESPILLALAAALLIAASVPTRHDRDKWWRGIWRPFAIAILAATAMSFHMKGVLFTPLFLVCIFFSGVGKETRTNRWIAIALTIGLAMVAMRYWSVRFSCPGDAKLAALLAKENLLSALKTSSDWRSLFGEAFKGMLPYRYIFISEIRNFPTSYWLPEKLVPSMISVLRFLPMLLFWFLAIGSALYYLVKACNYSWREKRLDFRPTISLISIGIILAWGFTQLNKNDYEGATILPLLVLFLVFGLSSRAWTKRMTQNIGAGVLCLAALSLVSQLDLLSRFGPALLNRAAYPGYVYGQKNSVSVFGYHEIREQIIETAHHCGIGTKGRAQHPLIDDVTYFAMEDSWQPFHRLGVLSDWNGSIKDPLAYLKSRGSEGVIVGCRYLSPELSDKAYHNGDFCCISTR